MYRRVLQQLLEASILRKTQQTKRVIEQQAAVAVCQLKSVSLGCGWGERPIHTTNVCSGAGNMSQRAMKFRERIKKKNVSCTL